MYKDVSAKYIKAMAVNKFRKNKEVENPSQNDMYFTWTVLALNEISSKPFLTVNLYTNIPSFYIQIVLPVFKTKIQLVFVYDIDAVIWIYWVGLILSTSNKYPYLLNIIT